MGLESGTYISDLVVTNPVGSTDAVSSLDGHDRLIKSTIKNTFPNITGAVTPTQAELNRCDITTEGTIEASKVVTSDASNNIIGGASITATTFVGALTGDVTGNATGSSGSCTGNAATATSATTATTATAVSAGAITLASFASVTAGTAYSQVGGNLTTGSGDATYTEKYNRRVLQAGVYRIYFGLKTSDVAVNAYARIYKNGSAEGTERTTGLTTYQYYTEDITFAAGDTFQIFMKHGTPASYTATVTELKHGVGSVTELFLPLANLTIGDR